MVNKHLTYTCFSKVSLCLVICVRNVLFHLKYSNSSKKKNLKTFPSAVTVLSEVFKENVNKHLKLT